MLGQQLYGGLLLRAEGTEFPADLIDFPGTDLLELFLQSNDDRRYLGHFEARQHAVHLLGHQSLRVIRLLHALAQIGVDDFLQVVDIVQINIL